MFVEPLNNLNPALAFTLLLTSKVFLQMIKILLVENLGVIATEQPVSTNVSLVDVTLV